MIFFEIFHCLISPTNTGAASLTYKPQMVHSLYYFPRHSNGLQDGLQQRSAHIGNQSLNTHESLANWANGILITWLGSILSIFSKSLCATASHGFILVIIYHIYVTIFLKKQWHNNIPYKNVRKQRFLITFWQNGHESLNINLFDVILIWEYVYVIYLLNLGADGAAVPQ